MTDRDIYRTLAKLACKYQNKHLYQWCVRRNQVSLHRKWAKEKNAIGVASR